MTGPGEYAPVVGVGTSMYEGGERNKGYDVRGLWGRGAEQERSNGSSIDEASSSLSDSSCRVKVGPSGKKTKTEINDMTNIPM